MIVKGLLSSETLRGSEGIIKPRSVFKPELSSELREGYYLIEFSCTLRWELGEVFCLFSFDISIRFRLRGS